MQFQTLSCSNVLSNAWFHVSNLSLELIWISSRMLCNGCNMVECIHRTNTL